MNKSLKTERGFDRVVNFSDAVVAIAITLLVLPLIDLLNDETSDSFGDILVANWESFVGFAFAFFSTALYWTIHHRTFELIDQYDAPIMWINTLWLALIVLLPFLAASYAQQDDNRLTFAMYCLDLALLSVVLAWLSHHIRRNPGLLAPEVLEIDLRTYRAWIYAGYFFLLGAAAMLIGINAAYGLFLLYFVGWWADRLDAKKDALASEQRAKLAAQAVQAGDVDAHGAQDTNEDAK